MSWEVIGSLIAAVAFALAAALCAWHFVFWKPQHPWGDDEPPMVDVEAALLRWAGAARRQMGNRLRR